MVTLCSSSIYDVYFLYQSLAVIEYLVANGSERAVDDIIEHTFQISVWILLNCPVNLDYAILSKDESKVENRF